MSAYSLEIPNAGPMPRSPRDVVWRFEVPPQTLGKRKQRTRRLPPSKNARMHWSTLARWSAAFREAAKEQAAAVAPALGRARIELVNYTCQPMDRDNLYSAAKPIVDGIVDAGVVQDDSDEYVDLRCRNERVRKRAEERVVVEIRAMDAREAVAEEQTQPRPASPPSTGPTSTEGSDHV